MIRSGISTSCVIQPFCPIQLSILIQLSCHIQLSLLKQLYLLIQLIQLFCRIQLRSTRSSFNSLSDVLSGTSSSLSPWPALALLLPLQRWSQQPTLTIKPTPCYFQRRSHLIHLRPLSMLLTLIITSIDSILYHLTVYYDITLMLIHLRYGRMSVRYW